MLDFKKTLKKKTRPLMDISLNFNPPTKEELERNRQISISLERNRIKDDTQMMKVTALICVISMYTLPIAYMSLKYKWMKGNNLLEVLGMMNTTELIMTWVSIVIITYFTLFFIRYLHFRTFARKLILNHGWLNIPYVMKYGWKRNLTFMFRTKPDFIIIGMSKCGTTSIYENLVKHPQIIRAYNKEIKHFSRKRGGIYRANFPLKKDMKGKITGEASTDYALFKDLPQVIKKELPNVKIILIFRDPTERALSFLDNLELLHKKHPEFTTDPEKWLMNELNHNSNGIKRKQYIKNKNLIHNQVLIGGKQKIIYNRWNKIFGNNLFVGFMDELTHDNIKFYEKLQRFLGVQYNKLEYTHENKSKSKKRYDQNMINFLKQYFRPYELTLPIQHEVFTNSYKPPN